MIKRREFLTKLVRRVRRGNKQNLVQFELRGCRLSYLQVAEVDGIESTAKKGNSQICFPSSVFRSQGSVFSRQFSEIGFQPSAISHQPSVLSEQQSQVLAES